MNYRTVERLGVVLGTFALVHGHWLLFSSLDASIASMVTFFASVLGGLIVADLVSGIVHWFADTVGHETWPIVGSTLIRPFREHHVDPMSITRHDFIETNGSSFLLVGLAWTVLVFLTDMNQADSNRIGLVAPALLFLCLTNEIHKMAHLGNQSKTWHQFFAKRGWLLSAEAHRHHHSGDFNTHFCITTGWLNFGHEKIKSLKRISYK